MPPEEPLPDAGTVALGTLMAYAARRVALTHQAAAQAAMGAGGVVHTSRSAAEYVMKAFAHLMQSECERRGVRRLAMRMPEILVLIRPRLNAIRPNDRISDGAVRQALESLFSPYPLADGITLEIKRRGRFVDYIAEVETRYEV